MKIFFFLGLFVKEILDGRFKNEYKMKRLKQQDGKKFDYKTNFNTTFFFVFVFFFCIGLFKIEKVSKMIGKPETRTSSDTK